jgi:hypothetical protein
VIRGVVTASKPEVHVVRPTRFLPSSFVIPLLLGHFFGSTTPAVAQTVPPIAATASSDDGNVPSNVLDGNLASRWSCDMAAGPCWIELDLGGVHSVGGVTIAWYNGTLRTNTFSIAASTTAGGSPQVFSGTSSGATTGAESYTFAAVSARYLRVTVSGSSVNNWASITEITVVAAAGSLPVTAVSASGHDGNVPANVLDANLNTRWSCDMSTAPCWILADLGSVQHVEAVSVAWYNGNLRTNTFSIAASASGTAFANVFSGRSSGTTTSPETYAFAAIDARYVRITVTDNSIHNGWASIVELRVYGSAAPCDAGTRDGFGIRKLYPSLCGGPQWNSTHWANNHDRNLTDRDPDDPTQVSQKRGDATTVRIDGQGVLHFTGNPGSEPRFYLNRPGTHPFRNVELTIYYRRVTDDGTDWGGLVCGFRSGPNGHSSPATNFCDAHTYYFRFRHDGDLDFEKELQHPSSSARGAGNIWGEQPLPSGPWIGAKFVIHNINSNTGVRLEAYRDLTGGADGGTWELLGDSEDIGGWAPPQNAPACSYARDFIPVVGGGVIILRNTGVTESQYKWLSVREIVPPMP